MVKGSGGVGVGKTRGPVLCTMYISLVPQFYTKSSVMFIN